MICIAISGKYGKWLCTFACLYCITGASFGQYAERWSGYSFDAQSCAEVRHRVADVDSLNAESLFYLGLCHYEQAEDRKAQQLFTKAIDKQPAFFPAYYFKGRSYLLTGDVQEALYWLDRAIMLDGPRMEYLEAKADALARFGQLDSAIFYLRQVVDMEASPGSAFLRLGSLLREVERPEEASALYRRALHIFEPADRVYSEVLYNLGLLDYLSGQFKTAERSFDRLLALEPGNYRVMSKYIQSLYAQEAYERGDALKTALYAAYQRGELPPYMCEKGFCFDQFLLEGNRVFAYEQLAEPESSYRKHLFYLTDAHRRVIATVFTEHNARAVQAGQKYMLAMQDASNQIVYFPLYFDERFDYKDLRRAVIKAFKGKLRVPAGR